MEHARVTQLLLSPGVGVARGVGFFKIGSKTLVATYSDAEKTFNQVTHGFAVGDWIELTGSTWADAQADDAGTLASALVVAVADVDNFTAYAIGGHFVTVTAHGQGSAGDVLSLSQSVAAGSTSTTPVNGIWQHVAVVIDANTFLIQSFSAAVL